MASSGISTEQDEPPHWLAVVLVLVQQQWLQVETVDALTRTSRSVRDRVHQHRLRRRVLQHRGFPSSQRVQYWLQQTRANELKQAALSTAALHPARGSFFLQLLGLSDYAETASLGRTGLEGEIGRDVDRTFPTLPFFLLEGGDGQRQLGNVLKAVALHAPDVAYCQGMNYVAASLLLVSSDAHREDPTAPNPQEASFWLLIALIRHFGMAEMWQSKMPALSRCIYLYQQLLRKHFYDLHAHLRNIGLHPSLIATQWFATLFARVLSLDVLVRVWDLVLVDGWKMVFRITLAITAHVRPQIMHLDMEECSEYFRQHPKLGLETVTADALIKDALSYKVTRKMLEMMNQERHMEYLRLRLQDAPLSHEHSILFPALQDEDGALNKQKSLAFIRSQLAELDTSAVSDTRVLRGKIEVVDKTIALTTTTLVQASYALNEATFAFQEQAAIKKSLQRQFDKALAAAVAEASSPRTSSRHGAFVLPSWGSHRSTSTSSSPSMLTYLQNRLAGCFERLPLLVRDPSSVPWATTTTTTTNSPLSRSSSFSNLFAASFGWRTDTEDDGDGDGDDDDDDGEADDTGAVAGSGLNGRPASSHRSSDYADMLTHLDALVPHLVGRLDLLWRALTVTKRAWRKCRRRYKSAQRVWQLAQIEHEEAQVFKDRLADQMLQLMLQSEQEKDEAMQQLFKQVDTTANAAVIATDTQVNGDDKQQQQQQKPEQDTVLELAR